MRPAITPKLKERRIGFLARLGLVLFSCFLLGIYGVAAWLDPYEPSGSPRRQGTHEQLGLAPCQVLRWTGKPCPTCGMTTAFSLLMRGDLPAAAQANLAGLTLALLGWPVLACCLFQATTATWWRPAPKDSQLLSAGAGLLGLMLLAWGLKLLVG